MPLSTSRQLSLLLLATLMGSGLFEPWPSAGQTLDVASVQAAPQARIVPPSPSYQFPNGKKFVYTVEWHSITAGMATMQFDSEGTGEKLTARATSSGAVNFLYPVHSWFNASIDPKTFCTTQLFKHSEEGKRKREIKIQVDPARAKSVLDEKNLKNGETRHEEDDSPTCATDILSGFFYLGSRPLLSNSDESLPVVDGGKPTVVRARVEAQEEIAVPAGNFHTTRVLLDPINGKFEGKGQIWVWYSNDAHIPIQMKAKLQWGTVMFKLQRIEN
jgi:hypothetical protein